ncbi:MAG TPA: amidohydrolase family protein, partial [Puia sp.]|nr:amidohydrolase family protein [Puia sp.]
MKKIIPALIALVFFISCSHQQAADKIYINAKIWTGDSANEQATAIAIRDGAIMYVGNEYQAYEGPNTQITDIDGKMIVPGFIDNHTHFLSGGYQLASVNLRAAKTKKEFIAILKEYANTHNDDR